MSIGTEDISTIIANIIKQQTVYKPFSFRTPPVTEVGGNVTSRLGEILKEFLTKHVLIVLDKVVYDLKLIDPYLLTLDQNNIKYTIFSDITGEPDTKTVAKGVNVLKNTNADFVLAVGGGSAIDTGKAIAVIGEYQDNLSSINIGGIKSRGIGLGAIPTTAGTGSEVTDITVIKDNKTGVKVPIKGAALIPDLAILDPQLMTGVPASITAATGMDALTHAIEAYTSIYSNPLSKAYAYHAIEQIVKFLPIAVANGDNLEARYQLAISAYKAGVAFSNAGLGLTHAISHQVGNILNMPHGVVNSILLPYVMIFNSLSSEMDYAEISRAMKSNNDSMSQRQCCNSAILGIFRLVDSLDIDTKFHLSDTEINLVATQAMQDICLLGNPRKVTKEQIEVFLTNILSGELLKRWESGA